MQNHIGFHQKHFLKEVPDQKWRTMQVAGRIFYFIGLNFPKKFCPYFSGRCAKSG
jgi:hypothetical protein